MALVAVAMVSILAMAALSIDIGTMYEAKAEAQRSADAAALTAARMISISGITGDPSNGSSSWQLICAGATSPATAAAIKVAQQNFIGGVSVPTGSVTVTYGAGKAGGANPDCSGLGADFGVNPTVTVTVQRTNLPIFFGRVFSLIPLAHVTSPSVSATASAEAFNPSNSGSVAGAMIPVNPRCVKPWIIPNLDPDGGGTFVNPLDGSITKQGVSQLGSGVIGESFTLTADCKQGAADCEIGTGNILNNPPTSTLGTIYYVPAYVQTAAGAVPSCATSGVFQQAIGGCDQSTVYACGSPGGAQADLLFAKPVTPIGGGDTFTAVQCLTGSSTGGEDTINPATFPFQIQAGLANPLVQKGVVFNNDIITTSNSIVTMPIYDGTALTAVSEPPVTIVGFLQAFINVPPVATDGSMNVIVLNVVGCSNTAANPPVAGTSPVPVRLITPP